MKRCQCGSDNLRIEFEEFDGDVIGCLSCGRTWEEYAPELTVRSKHKPYRTVDDTSYEAAEEDPDDMAEYLREYWLG